MPRRKLPEDDVMVTSGIKLPKDIIRELERLGVDWDCAPSAAGRELLLLGLDVFRATQTNKIFTDYIELQSEQIDAYQQHLTKIVAAARKLLMQSEEGDIEKTAATIIEHLNATGDKMRVMTGPQWEEDNIQDIIEKK